MNILLITGATRPNNNTQRAVKLVQKYFAQKYPEIELKTVSPNDYPMPYDDKEGNPEYENIVNWANALIILSPEYNHGYPGRLKTLLDSTNKPYHYKHVLLGGVSDGPFGGARMIENLSPIIKNFRMYMSKDDMIFPNIDKKVSIEGEALDQELYSRITKVIDDFIVRISN